jgi:hypothetical protein
LDEELGTLGKLGSAICLIGAVVIVLHAPPDEEIETIDQILHYAIQPGTKATASSLIDSFAIPLGHLAAPRFCPGPSTNTDQAFSCTPLLSWHSQSS